MQVVPILLLHGWPGSVREFYEAIPLLTKQTSGYDFAFEVIVPSLPGYGFSDVSKYHLTIDLYWSQFFLHLRSEEDISNGDMFT